jgi:hypothetical protein
LVLGLSFSGIAAAFEGMIISDAGDYIGNGQQYHLVSQGNEFVTEQADGSGVRLQWQRESGIWTFKFAGPGGAALQVGPYENAQRQDTPSQQPGHPGMDISGLGRGCNTLTGRFDVRDVAYDSSGALTRLAVDATQYCEGSARALHVYLRFGDTQIPLFVGATVAHAGADQTVSPGSSVALDGTQSAAADGGALSYAWTQVGGMPVQLNAAQSATPSFTAPTPSAEWAVLTFQLEVTDSRGVTSVSHVEVVVSQSTQLYNEIRLVSGPSDPVGAGVTYDETVAASRLTLGRNVSNGISLQYAFSGSPAPTLNLQAAAPNAAQLGVEHDELAYRYPFSDPTGKAGLDASLAVGCNLSISRFVVHDVAYDDGGAVIRLALDFVQLCLDVPGAAPLYGYIRIGTVVPITSRAPTASAGADVLTQPGQSISLDASASVGGATQITSYAWQQLSGPTVTLAQSGAAATFAAPAVPSGGADLTFLVTVTNAGGYTDTDSVVVHVQGADEPRFYIAFASSEYDFVTQGQSGTVDGNTGAFTTIGRTINGFGREQIGFSFYGLSDAYVILYSAQGQQLTTGVYADLDTTAPDHAGLDFGADGRACDRTIGSMTILEIARDASGNVTKLAVDFVTRCDLGSPTYGSVRYNSTIPQSAPLVFASAGRSQNAVGGDGVTLNADLSYTGSATSVSYAWQQVSGPPVTLISPSGDRVTFTAPAAGGTLQFQLTVTTGGGQSDTSSVTVTVQPTGTPRTLLVLDPDPGNTVAFGQSLRLSDSDGLTYSFDPPTSDSAIVQIHGPYTATLYLWAPFNQTLVPGAYEGARLFGDDMHSALSFPGLEFGFDQFFCNLSYGRFVVRELTRDSSGQIVSLAVDFQQICGGETAYVRGALRLNSAVPVGDQLPLADAGPDLTVRAGQSIDVDGSASTAGNAGPASYRWAQISGPALALTGSALPLAHIVAPALPTGTADAVLSLTVTDSHGVSATDTMTVHILGNDARGTQLIASRYQGDGTKVADYTEDTNSAYTRVFNQDATLTVSFVAPTSLLAMFHIDPSTHLPPGLYHADQYQFTFYPPGDDFCSVPGGALRVLEAQYDTSGQIASLAFDFDVRCPSYSYAGGVRINSAQPLVPGSAALDTGGDQTVTSGDAVVLDGSRSLILGTPIGNFQWTQISGPQVTLSSSSPGVANFTAPSVSTATPLQFRLDVATLGTSPIRGSAVATVTVNPKPSGNGSGSGSGSGSGPGSGPGGSGGGGAIGMTMLMGLLMLAIANARSRYLRSCR